jgi:hypothetical protein
MVFVPYLHRAIIIAPASLSALSSSIAQAIGPSSRDDLSFDSISATKAGTQYQVCDVAITTETHAGYQAMQQTPAILAGAVAQGWVRKQMDDEPPTAQECADWLAASHIWLGDAWAVTEVPCWDILASLGFTYVPPALPDGLQ